MTYRNIFYSIAILSTGIFLAYCNGSAHPAEESLSAGIQTPVTVTSISREPMNEFIELNATSSFLLKSYIKANATGYLQPANLHIGQLVQRRQTLFTIRTKEAVSIGNAVNSLDSSFRFSGTNNIKTGTSGYITSLDHQPGDYVQDGEQLAVISDINSFVFIMNMPYELRTSVINRKTVEVILPDGEKLTGFIASAMPTVDSAAQTQSMVIRVKAKHSIPENLVAQIIIPKTLRTTSVSLPRAAVLANETQEDFWIMKLINDTTAVKVPVKKGAETNDRIEIISPMLLGTDKILITGNYGLEDTASVKIIQQPQ